MDAFYGCLSKLGPEVNHFSLPDKLVQFFHAWRSHVRPCVAGDLFTTCSFQRLGVLRGDHDGLDLLHLYSTYTGAA